MRNRCFRPGFWIIWVLFPAAATAQQRGALSGVVVDEQGKPVPNARVVYNSVPAVRPPGTTRTVIIETPRSGTLRTGPDGRFQASGLRTGAYYLCAIGPQRQHLLSCQWGGLSTPLRVAERQMPEARLVLRTGILINLSIQDPAGRLAASAAFRAGIISDSGHYARAEIVSRTAGNVQYAVVAPRGIRVRLLIDTPLTVRDATGRTIEKRRPSLAIQLPQSGEVNVTLAVN